MPPWHRLLVAGGRYAALGSWAALVLGGLAIGWLSGRLDFEVVPDTRSYLQFPFYPLSEMLRSQRTPGYPLWLLFWRQTGGLDFVPAAQIAVHATAAWFWMRELKQWELPASERIAAMLAVVLGCTAMDHIHVLSTDALAASLGVVTATLTMRWARLASSTSTAFAVWAAAIALAAAVAIAVRPAYLFLIPWVFVAGWALRVRCGGGWLQGARQSLFPALLTAVPVVAWMLLRLVVVDDFGIAPFGHQNLAGVLVQLVSPEELASLEGDAGRLAAAIEEQRSRLVASGHRFAEGDAGATMTVESRWDDMTYLVVVPAAASMAGEDTIANHRLIAAMNRQIVARWPERYAIWLAKAARRAVWGIAADIAMHPLFLVAGCAGLLVVLFRAVAGQRRSAARRPERQSMRDREWPAGLDALAILAVTYTAAHVGFVILSSPPIGRFADAAAIFVPAWLAAVFLHTLRSHAPSSR